MKLKEYIQQEVKRQLNPQIITEANDDVIAANKKWFKTVDFTPLTAEIQKYVGVDIDVKYSLDTDGKSLIIKSENVVKKIPQLKNIIKSIEVFSYSVYIFKKSYNYHLDGKIYVNIENKEDGILSDLLFSTSYNINNNGKWVFKKS